MKWIVFILSLWVTAGFAGDNHTLRQIDTCYHWLKRDMLQIKMEYADDHNGDLYFFGTSPIYCWRSPLGAFSAWESHGNNLIRIKLKPGTHTYHAPRTTVAQMGPRSLIYSNDNKWHEYTIAPAAVESWSMYHPNMIMEMRAELQFYQAGLATADDVFYPFAYFDINYLNQTIPPIIARHEQLAQQGFARIYGKNQKDHFKTSYPLAWHKFLKRDESMKLVPLPTIQILEASYGRNLDPRNRKNSTKNAADFCDGKTLCEYKVHPKYLTDPAPGQDKDFEVSWKCSNSPAIKTIPVPAPADNKVFNIECKQ